MSEYLPSTAEYQELLKFHYKDHVLVSVEYINHNIIFKTWLPGVITNRSHNTTTDKGIIMHMYDVKMDKAILITAHLDPSEFGIITVVKDDSNCVCEYSIENTIKLVNSVEVLESKIKFNKSYDHYYNDYLKIAVESENIISLSWLYQKIPRKLSSPEKRNSIMKTILMTAAKLNKINVIDWVKFNYPNNHKETGVELQYNWNLFFDVSSDKQMTWSRLFLITDDFNRNIFHIALGIQGHSDFVNMIIKAIDNDSSYVYISKNPAAICIYLIRTCFDIDNNTCLHLAAINNKIMIVMNIIYQLMISLPRCSCYDPLGSFKDSDFDISFRNNEGLTVTDIVQNSNDELLINEFMEIVKSIKILVNHDKVMNERAKLFKCHRDLSDQRDLSDMEYDSLIFDIIIDKSITAENYFKYNVNPVIREQVKYIDLFFYSLKSCNWNLAKLLVNLDLIDKQTLDSSVNEKGQNIAEVVCYGSWWDIVDLDSIEKKMSHYQKAKENKIITDFINWDESIVYRVKDELDLFGSRSLWDILDDLKKIDDEKELNIHKFCRDEDICIDIDTYYKDIRPRGCCDLLQWLIHSCDFLVYPTFRFILEECDKYMAEWYISYRLTLNELMKEKFGDLYELISSYLFTDFKICKDSILREVVSLPVGGNNEKCVYLVNLLISKFKADPFLRKLQHSETALHIAIKMQHVLCVKYFLSKEVSLIHFESRQEQLLPFHFALLTSNTDTICDFIISHFRNTYLNIHIKSGQIDDSDYENRFREIKRESLQLLMKLEDVRGRTTEVFACQGQNGVMKVCALSSIYEDFYDCLILLLENGTESDLIYRFTEKQVAGRNLHLQDYNYALMKIEENKMDIFGSIAEHKFLYTCISEGRLDIIKWYANGINGYRNHCDPTEDTIMKNILHWRFNSLIKSELNGKGIFHHLESSLRRYLNSKGNNLKTSFYQGHSALEVAKHYNQKEVYNYLNDLFVFFEENEKIGKFFSYVNNKELANCEGIINITSNSSFRETDSNTNNLGIRTMIRKGFSIAEIKLQLDKGLEMKNRFRSTLTLQKSKDKFDLYCLKSSFSVLNSSRLYQTEDEYCDKGIALECCIMFNFEHILKWIVEMIPSDYETRGEILSYCMDEAITYGRISIIDYLFSKGVTINDLPISGKEQRFRTDCSSYTMIAACSLEFDIFKYFYEHPELNDRPDVDSILINCIEHTRYVHFKCSYISWNEEFAEEIISKEEQVKIRIAKQQNRKKIFEYFFKNRQLTFNSSADIVKALLEKFRNLEPDENVDILDFDLMLYLVEEVGINISKIDNSDLTNNAQVVINLFAKKKRELKIIKAIEEGQSVDALESLERGLSIDISTVKMRQGRQSMLYLATLAKHTHIVEWLLSTKSNLDLNETDFNGRTAEVIARVLRLDSITLLFKNHNRKINSSILIQTTFRKYKAKKHWMKERIQMLSNLDNSHGLWVPVLLTLLDLELLLKLKPLVFIDNFKSWAELKAQTRQVGNVACAVEDDEVIEDCSEPNDSILNINEGEDITTSDILLDSEAFDLVPTSSISESIKLTESVLQWTRRMKNSLLLEVFQSRLLQLSSGCRSYCLSKRLKYCRSSLLGHVAYETKLDKGQRILWTESVSRGIKSIIVWYVSTHDKVPYHIGLIEESFRSASSTILLNNSNNFNNESNLSTLTRTADESDILIDPKRNNILVTYNIQPSQLHMLKSDSDWIPPMTLTEEELDIVNSNGSVLLLGRSGSGKTVCLLSRILKDRNNYKYSNPLRQLFVCYTDNLCSTIKSKYQKMDYKWEQCLGGDSNNNNNNKHSIQFRCITNLMFQLLNDYSSSGDSGLATTTQNRFPKDKKINYSEFRDDYWPKLLTGSIHKSIGLQLDPLIVWTQIRSFFKGSIEAAINMKNKGVYLDLCQYLDDREFSPSRCKIDKKETKTIIYNIFEKYQILLAANNCWDDMDLVASVFSLLYSHYEKTGDISTISSPQSKQKEITQIVISPENKLYDRIYCDEVQDMSQSEIGVLLVCVGLDNNNHNNPIFFAGDTAQTIACGVDFRFEEVRSCIFKLTGGVKKKINSVVTLKKSLRSHDGILKVGNVVLQKLFEAFPRVSDHSLAETGLCVGPRPGLLKICSDEELGRFCRNQPRMKILTWDECVENLSNRLNGLGNDLNNNVLVLGIRQVKGLEYQDVAIVDFFQSKGMEIQLQQFSGSIQKAWKLLLSNENNIDSFPAYLEMQLKILYTAITRCSSKLVFIETATSVAGTAWFDFLCRLDLAQRIETTPELNKEISSTTTTTSETITTSTTEEETITTTTTIVTITTVTTSTSPNHKEKNSLILSDEWFVHGLVEAVSAEGECCRSNYISANKLLHQAIKCFKMCNNENLFNKAANHRLGVEYHMELKRILINSNNDKNNEEINTRIKELVPKILFYYLKCGKFIEAKELCEFIMAIIKNDIFVGNIMKRILKISKIIEKC